MKRALPSYEDLEIFTETGEEGEIEESENEEAEESSIEDSQDSSLEEIGLKPVLPVGKYTETFKEGDVPQSGEQYLCTVQSERKKLGRIFVCERRERDDSKGVALEDLCKRFGGQREVEVDMEWAEGYWRCYEENERSFLANLSQIEEEAAVSDSPIKYLSLSNPTDCYSKLYATGEIQPSLSLLKLLQDDQELVAKLINFHRKWFETDVFADEPEILGKVATWLQALLMVRDSRLTSPEIAALRQLAAVLIEKYRNFTEIKEIVLVIGKKYSQFDLIKFI